MGHKGDGQSFTTIILYYIVLSEHKSYMSGTLTGQTKIAVGRDNKLVRLGMESSESLAQIELHRQLSRVEILRMRWQSMLMVFFSLLMGMEREGGQM